MTQNMKAMVLTAQGQPLEAREIPVPQPGPRQVLIKVGACGVCRTDLHIADGDLTQPKLPLILGHEIVGRVAKCGDQVEALKAGQRVGVPWLGKTCGACGYCAAGSENLCDEARFTGYDVDGGYAEFVVASEQFCFPLPDGDTDASVAPLLCAGLIGYRALLLGGSGQRVGLYGFGAAAHMITQVLRFQSREVFAFTRPGDNESQSFARSLGASWAGDSDMPSPDLLDVAIIFAPVGELVPVALRSVRKGGVVVCAGIHMSEIPAFPYDILWGERVIRSVANLTRSDGESFMAIAVQAGVRSHVKVFDLADANEALACLRDGKLTGAAVLQP